MPDKFSRTELIFGTDAMEKLKNSRVAVFGAGGVGGYAIEGLVRSGIGSIDIIDNDTVSITNINRQIIALENTVGKLKVDVAEERIKQINPDCNVRKYAVFYMPETAEQFDFSRYDYIIDAIDTVTGKIAVIENAEKCGTPVISSMGAGNKINPEMFEVADIYKTSVCPLAKVMRYELRKRGIKKLKVVYSKEKPLIPAKSNEICSKKRIPGSCAFAPSVAGLIIAGEVIKDITGIKNI